MKEEGIGASFGFRDGKLRDEGRFVFDFDFERIAVDDAAGQVKNLEQFAGGEAMLGVVDFWFARGVDSDKEDERGDYVNTGTVEIQQRAQYTAWLRLMSAEG